MGRKCRRFGTWVILQSFFHVLPAHRLLLQQLPGQSIVGRVVAFQQRLSAHILFGHETLDLGVDHFTSLRTDLAIVLDGSSQILELLTRVAHGSELLAHAEFRDHAPG